ncbi:FixH family protein [Hazenella coriacea]|uniref:YtkA-like protein n=1 Tax=Hazenella coriacea TaxID=1179467 RepID=A0A4R3L3L6_9BACL|nr:FixH family protein [Hazenella coriacea]TCS94243.1 YtkA-like protein [Hazenella coriacea]
MKRISFSFKLFLGLFTLIFMTACNQGNTDHDHHQNTPQIPGSQNLTLGFQTVPAQPMPGQPIELQATVKEDNKPFTSARVELEVWKKGNKKHDMLPAKHSEQGIYKATTTYQEEGEYLVIVHVTTPMVHQMIDSKFQVGQGQASQATPDTGGLQMNLMLPNETTKGQTTKITAHVKNDGNPLSQAEVQIEYWKEGSQTKEASDTAEISSGDYSTSIRFPEAGTYHLVLHVEKGILKGKEEKTLLVK